MAVISKGQTFATGDQVSALKLNNLADNATFASGAVDNVSTQLSGGAIVVKDGGVTTAKLNDGSVTTAKIADSNVIKSKIENVADMKVLGNTSGSASAPQEVSILDDDTMATASATTLATSESIKAYVDSATNFTPSTYAGEESVTLPNGLIMKFGSKSVPADGTATVSFATDFPGGIAQVQLTFQTTINIASDAGLSASSQLVTGFTIQSGATNTETVAWMAIGY